MRKLKIGYFERKLLQEEFARDIYRELGYRLKDVPDNYMEQSQHPAEIAIYRAVGNILDKLTKGE